MRYFAISDIHGCFAKLDKLLRFYNPDRERIVFMGDYIDRGPDSVSVLTAVKKMKNEYGAIVLRGNHEELFLSAIDDPKEMLQPYLDNGGNKTLDSLLSEYVCSKYTPLKVTQLVNEKRSVLVEFIREMEFFYEDENHIFVHAGVNPNLLDWRETSKSDFLNIRKEFIFRKNNTGRTIVFGHTETKMINSTKSTDIWISECGTKVGIDGSASSGGCLHGVVFEDGKIVQSYKT